MRKRGILNAELNAALSRLGHGDTIVIADCGLPIPSQVPVIDLALVMGVPTFSQVLKAVLDELTIDGGTAASESEPEVSGRWIRDEVPGLQLVPHEELKTLVADVRFAVRTGEATPYANVVLRCGVAF